MIIGIYQRLIIHIIFVFHGVNTISVEIEGSEVGLISDNGTIQECSYKGKTIIQILTVSLMAFNKSSGSFETIATYIPGHTTLLNTQGQYLNGRVTLTPITQSSTKAIMTINNLKCIDDTFYRCVLTYLDSGGTKSQPSNVKRISVQVPPSKPDSVSLVHTQADSSATTTKGMEYSTSLPSNAVTSNENNTISALKMEKQNTTTAFNYSTIQTTGHNSTTSNPSTTSYRPTAYSLQQTTNSQGIAEGDNITAVCTGDVGNPPAEHVFEKYFNGKIFPLKDTFITTSILNMPENCSYYRTSNLTFQVMAEDNNAVIRCIVNSSMAGTYMYIETAPIEVYYHTTCNTLKRSSSDASVYIGVVAGVVVVLLVLLGCYLFKRKRKERDESTENNSSTNNLMHYCSKHAGESRLGAYDYVGLEVDAPVVSSGKKEQNFEDVRKHNKEYMKNQTNQEKNESKSPTSQLPVIYAEVNKATQLKNRPETSNQQDDDTYAGTQEGIYDQSVNRRHKENENAEQFDKIGDIKEQNSTDDSASSVKSNQKGSYVNQALNKGEKQVATVPPISRSSAGSQGYEQTSELSQKGFENVKGTDNTHTSTGQSINQTSF